VLIGHATHAFPPTGGQGAGMAVEDADGLGLALDDVITGADLQERLSVWLKCRMNRIDRVAEYTASLGRSRVAPAPPVANDGKPKETKPANYLEESMIWLGCMIGIPRDGSKHGLQRREELEVEERA
jgi:hypothetical protein